MLSRAYRTALRQAARGNWLGYGDPRGSPILRETIANMLSAHRGIVATADNICITRGSQMAIFLAARILVRPGETVVVEALSYSPAWEAFRAAGASVVGARLDDNGLDVEDLEALCRKHKVRALYLTPHHQFPTTVSLTPQRRLRLLDLAGQFGFAVIEDDYDHEFHFEQQPLLPIASYAPRRTVYIGSMSKLLLPGLRIGYVAAAPDVIRQMAKETVIIDRQGNVPTELAVVELIESGELHRHARKALQVYLAPAQRVRGTAAGAFRRSRRFQDTGRRTFVLAQIRRSRGARRDREGTRRCVSCRRGHSRSALPAAGTAARLCQPQSR